MPTNLLGLKHVFQLTKHCPPPPLPTFSGYVPLHMKSPHILIYRHIVHLGILKTLRMWVGIVDNTNFTRILYQDMRKRLFSIQAVY
jgi:hypothetical protein